MRTISGNANWDYVSNMRLVASLHWVISQILENQLCLNFWSSLCSTTSSLVAVITPTVSLLLFHSLPPGTLVIMLEVATLERVAIYIRVMLA